MKARVLVLVGTVMYVVAWLLPVHNSLGDLGSGKLPGWEAFLIALVAPYDQWSSSPWYLVLAYNGSALSNIFLIVAVAIVLGTGRIAPRFLRAILMVSAVLNTHWFVLGDHRGDLRIGYYLWAGSFFLITLGLVLEAQREGGSSESPAAQHDAADARVGFGETKLSSRAACR